jgi:ribosomal protein L13E
LLYFFLQVRIGDRRWAFDAVFGPEDCQDAVYQPCAAPLVSACVSGYNATVLAYGQTGAGKTYTMGEAGALPPGTEEKNVGALGNGIRFCRDSTALPPLERALPRVLPATDGMIPRALCDLFHAVERQRAASSSIQVHATYLEIYTEEIRDLLRPSKASKDIAVREAVGGSIVVRGAHEVPVATAKDAMAVFAHGSINRTTGSTLMNDSSSRSHAIFTVFIEQKPVGSGSASKQRPEQNSSVKVVRSKFHLVDLAGSERAKRTGAVGLRLKESVRINQGLLALSKVISALTDGARKCQIQGGSFFGRHQHVPYRDSKLTRLLQDSLGGNSNTAVIACVSSADCNMQETVNTLKYASKARNIQNVPIVNEGREIDTPVADHGQQQRQQQQVEKRGLNNDGLSEMRAHIASLKSQLNSATSGQAGQTMMAVPEGEGSIPIGESRIMQELLVTQAALLKVRETVGELSREPTLGRKALAALKEIMAFTEEAASVRGMGDSREGSVEGTASSSSAPLLLWPAVTAAWDLQANLFRSNKELKKAIAELATCKEDLARDEEIFAGKLQEIRKEQAVSSLLRERNAALCKEVASLREQWQTPVILAAPFSVVRKDIGGEEPPPQRHPRRELRSKKQAARRQAGVAQRTAAAAAAAAAATATADHRRLAVELEQAEAALTELQTRASSTQASTVGHQHRLDEGGSDAKAASLGDVCGCGRGPANACDVSCSDLESLPALIRQSEEKGRALQERRALTATLSTSAAKATVLLNQYRQRLGALQREVGDLRRAVCVEERKQDREQLLGHLRAREDELQALLRQKSEQDRVLRLQCETTTRLGMLAHGLSQLEVEKAGLDARQAKMLQRDHDRITQREQNRGEALARAKEAVDIFRRHLRDAARRRDACYAQAETTAAEALATEARLQDEGDENGEGAATSDAEDSDEGCFHEHSDRLSASTSGHTMATDGHGGSLRSMQDDSPFAGALGLSPHWLERKLQEVARAVHQRQEIQRDLQRREEVAIELRETQQARRRFLDANVISKEDSMDIMLRSSQELRATLDGLSANIADLNAQIAENTSSVPFSNSERRQLLATELPELRKRREEALLRRAELELELEHADSGHEELREIDDKLEALQTEVDYKDDEIRRCLESSEGGLSDRLGDECSAARANRSFGVRAAETTAVMVAASWTSVVEIASKCMDTVLQSDLARTNRPTLEELVRWSAIKCVAARLSLAEETARASALDERLDVMKGECERIAAALRAELANRSEIETHLDVAAKDLRRIRAERNLLRGLLEKLMASPSPLLKDAAVVSVAHVSRHVRVPSRALRDVSLPPPPPPLPPP